ncbi:sulfite exporter TauE/SafE family protein [Methylocystis echinoides]|uniref:urease accessory protein UreH domain-containing protein n=1 Tax=Methylocystis echinoides TaxID=29468 RepID=UPI0034347165
MNGETITFRARGMHCHGCEHVIEARLRKLAGVRQVTASYPTEQVVVDYDPARVEFAALRATVEELGYRVEEGERAQRPLARRLLLAAGALLGLAALILVDTRWISAGGAPDIAQHMSLWLIFVLGLVTGFHCIGMCGAFVVSYTAADAGAGRSSALSHLAFATGKTLSYTAIGALFGALGAFIAFTPLLRGAAGVAAGVFLIVFGLNMLGLFAPLRRFRLGLPAPLQRWVYREAGGRHRPFVIGLLNGLMIACGPLQAMYVMAAGTGSAVEGAKMLFAFGLGTLPVMLAFGAVASLLSSAATHRLLRASGVIVVALGAVMINRGLILTGWGVDLASIVARMRQTDAPIASLAPAPAVQIIEMEANGLGYQPSRFTLTKGVPVKWVINATKITSCNNRIVVPAFGLEFDLKPGLQTIEFTPTQSGVVPWSCWMGMIRGEFVVTEPGAAPPPAAPETAQEAPSPPQETAQPAPAEAPRRYVVRRGDTLKAIARRLYGDAGRWRDIARANPGLGKGRLKPGQVLTLPSP